MKKTYIAPTLEMMHVEVQNHLMDLSKNGSYSISEKEASTDAFVKGESSSRYNVWDDDWSRE